MTWFQIINPRDVKLSAARADGAAATLSTMSPHTHPLSTRGDANPPLIARLPRAFVAGEGMDADEREVYDFLGTFGESWVNAKEICRRASTKKRFNEDNN